eukprot:SAG11_NODE_15934_length_562_cov_0.764579_1_plen_95_part_01
MYPHHSKAAGTQLHRIASNGLERLPLPQRCSPTVVQLASEGLTPAAQPAVVVLPSAALTHCSTIPIAGQTPLGRTAAVEQSEGDAAGAQPPKPWL